MEFITSAVLSLSHGGLVLFLIILGFIWMSRPIFYDVVCLLALSILCNVVLKLIFQIPLAPTLCKEGFAFPSGHMQALTVFYGYLGFRFQNSGFSVLIVALLLGYGFSLVYAGYHNYEDVLGAVFFACLLMLMYQMGTLKYPKAWPWILWGISTALVLRIALIHTVTATVWMAYYTLVGCILAGKYCNHRQQRHAQARKKDLST